MNKFLLLFLAVSFVTGSVNAAKNLDDLRGLELGHAKLPIYNKENLQLMAFCDKAQREGRLLVGSGTVLDIIRRGADIDSIKDGWELRPYNLEAPLQEVVKFWGHRLYSEGIIKTARAEIDQENRIAAGSEPVFFRSPALDLNGIGFECDFNKRTVLVRSDVKIVLRMGNSDPRRIFVKGAKLPAKYEYITATSDSMLIDLANNQVILIGDVKINESRSGIDCDRMTIYLDRKESGKEGDAFAAGEKLEGVSRILCDGNVRIYRKQTEQEIKENGREIALADHMVYEVKNGTVSLTGDDKRPRIQRGREELSGQRIVLFREQERAAVLGGCNVRVVQPAKKAGQSDTVMTIDSKVAQFFSKENHIDFIGDVKVNEPQMELTCDQMRVFLREIPGAEKKQSVADGTLTALPEFGAGGKRELDQIKCRGNVRVTHKGDVTERVRDDRSMANRRGDAVAFRRWAAKNDREAVVLCAAPLKSVKEKMKTTITSKESDLNYSANKLVFRGDVQVRDPRMKLDCDKMELILEERKLTPGNREMEKQLDGAFGGNGSSRNKTLARIVCTGNVHAVEEQGDIRTDKLTIYFREVAPGMPVQSGMFQSNGTQISKVVCDGNFVMESRPVPGKKNEKESVKSPMGALTGSSNTKRTVTARQGILDFMSNESEFHGDVKVHDEQGDLTCQDMYLYATKTDAAQADKNAKNAKSAGKPVKVVDPDADPMLAGDADPFAAGMDKKGESTGVPDRISLMPGLELSRIVCKKDVLLVRRTPKGEQRAAGEMADYQVATKKIIMTGTPEVQPWMMEEQGSKIAGDRIVVDVESGTMKVDGRTQVDFSF